MKKQLIILSLLGLSIIANAQDTIIERPNFALEIKRVKSETKKIYTSEKVDSNFHIVQFLLRNDLQGLIEKWLEYMELESIDYRIEPKLNQKTEGNIIDDSFIELILTNTATKPIDLPQMHREAFEIFASVLGLTLKTETEKHNYFELNILDFKNSSIATDQKKFWSRTEMEEYIYYERITYRRIADLLARKLNSYVKPIPYNYLKYNVQMPYSDDLMDLKYAMIEHGLEITEVTKTIEVLVIIF